MKERLEITLEPGDGPHRWRATARGTGRDGDELLVERESWDRGDVVKEAALAWFQAAERVEPRSVHDEGPSVHGSGGSVHRGGRSVHGSAPVQPNGAARSPAAGSGPERSGRDAPGGDPNAHRDVRPENLSELEVDRRMVQAADALGAACLERAARLARISTTAAGAGLREVALGVATGAVRAALARATTSITEAERGTVSTTETVRATDTTSVPVGDRPPPHDSGGETGHGPELGIGRPGPAGLARRFPIGPGRGRHNDDCNDDGGPSAA